MAANLDSSQRINWLVNFSSVSLRFRPVRSSAVPNDDLFCYVKCNQATIRETSELKRVLAIYELTRIRKFTEFVTSVAEHFRER